MNAITDYATDTTETGGFAVGYFLVKDAKGEKGTVSYSETPYGTAHGFLTREAARAIAEAM